MKAISVKLLIFLLLFFAGTLAFAQKDAHHNNKSKKDTTITLSLGGLTGDDEEEKEKVDSLIDTFSSLLPCEFKFEDNRGIIFNESDAVPMKALAFYTAAL